MVLALTAAPLWPQAAHATFPQTLCVAGNHLVRGGDGLRATVRRQPARIAWQALSGVQTFEPVCVGDQVFVGSHSGLYALDANDGRVRWRTGEGGIYSPVIADGAVFAAGLDGTVRRLAADDGTERWRHTLRGWVYPPAVTTRHVVVGGRAHAVTALDIDSGTPQWRRELGQELVHRPVAATAAGPVLVATYSPAIVALDAGDGRILWRHELDSPPTLPAVAGDHVVYGNRAGELVALGIGSGEVAWRSMLGAAPAGAPSATNGLAWIGAADGRVLAWRADDGKRARAVSLGNGMIGSPLVFGDGLCVAQRHGIACRSFEGND